MRELHSKFIMSSVTLRQFRILSAIEKHNFYTLQNLHEELGFSKKTLIKDIVFLKNHFKNSASFVSKNTGYYFKEEDRYLYFREKESLLENEIWFEIIHDIFYGKLKDINTLADYYHYSESTMQRFASKVSLILKEYNLVLTLDPVNICGEEASIRKFFFDFFYESDYPILSMKVLRELQNIVIDTIPEERLGVHSYEMGTSIRAIAFCHHLYISIIRVKNGNNLLLPRSVLEIDQSQNKDYGTLKLLQPIIKKYFGVQLSNTEILGIHLIAVCQRSVDFPEKEKLFFKQFNQWGQIEELTMSYLDFNNIDDNSKYDYYIFFSSFLLSRKLYDMICPTWNKIMSEDIQLVKNLYPLMYESNFSFLISSADISHFSEDYLEDIAIGLTIYQETLRDLFSSTKRVLFLLEGDYLLIQSIRIQIAHVFGKKYMVSYVALEELNEELLNNNQTDLIVTNYSPYIESFNIITNYVLTNRIPNQKDWENIFDKLRP